MLYGRQVCVPDFHSSSRSQQGTRAGDSRSDPDDARGERIGRRAYIPSIATQSRVVGYGGMQANTVDLSGSLVHVRHPARSLGVLAGWNRGVGCGPIRPQGDGVQTTSGDLTYAALSRRTPRPR